VQNNYFGKTIEIYKTNKNIKTFFKNVYLLKINLLALIVPETFIRTEMQGQSDLAIDPDQESMYIL